MVMVVVFFCGCFVCFVFVGIGYVVGMCVYV